MTAQTFDSFPQAAKIDVIGRLLRRALITAARAGPRNDSNAVGVCLGRRNYKKRELQKMKIAKLLAFALFVSVTLGLTACNTMEGLGTDVSKGGDAIHDSARDTKNNM
jgi:entericidin B